jgi:hypothetical protein
VKDRSDIHSLEARLARVWRENEGAEIGRPWKAAVMDAVRDEAELARAVAGPPVERLVRNAFLAAAAAALAAIAIFGARAATLDPSFELARLFASDPQGLLQLVLVL